MNESLFKPWENAHREIKSWDNAQPFIYDKAGMDSGERQRWDIIIPTAMSILP